MQGQFWKILCGTWIGHGAERTHDARHSPWGEPRGRRQVPPPSFPGLGMSPQVQPARPKRSAELPRAGGASEPFRTPSGQFTEPCVAHPSRSLHKQTGLLRRFPDHRPHACFRKTDRRSTCGFTSSEISVLSHPQSNVVNRHCFKMAFNN